MHALHLHRHLIGRQGSRYELNTPALVLDLDLFERNLALMAQRAAARGIELRPHAKTHKCAEIARLQIGAGAVGVCCAKLGEAEALADEGITDILITSPVVGSAGVARLASLALRCRGLMSVVDHPDAVAALAATGASLSLIVDIDPGLHRTGVASSQAALTLVRQITAAPNLSFSGVQYYCGAQQHIESVADRRAAMIERAAYLRNVVSVLNEQGFAPHLITGGGTGTHMIDMELGLLNELQVGSYIFMDRQYGDCDEVGGPLGFATALTVQARVISANHSALVTVDAGFKAFATEAGAPVIIGGAPAGSVYHFMGDEHGCVVPPRGIAPPALGELVSFVTPHCDPTVNLYDAFHVVRGDTLMAIWPIQARGRSA